MFACLQLAGVTSVQACTCPTELQAAQDILKSHGPDSEPLHWVGGLNEDCTQCHQRFPMAGESSQHVPGKPLFAEEHLPVRKQALVVRVLAPPPPTNPTP